MGRDCQKYLALCAHSEQHLLLPLLEASYLGGGGWSEPVGHFLHSLHGSLEKSVSFKITVTWDYFSS